MLVRSLNARNDNTTVIIFKIMQYGWFLDDSLVHQMFAETGAIESIVAVYNATKKLSVVTVCLEILVQMPH